MNNTINEGKLGDLLQKTLILSQNTTNLYNILLIFISILWGVSWYVKKQKIIYIYIYVFGKTSRLTLSQVNKILHIFIILMYHCNYKFVLL